MVSFLSIFHYHSFRFLLFAASNCISLLCFLCIVRYKNISSSPKVSYLKTWWSLLYFNNSYCLDSELVAHVPVSKMEVQFTSLPCRSESNTPPDTPRKWKGMRVVRRICQLLKRCENKKSKYAGIDISVLTIYLTYHRKRKFLSKVQLWQSRPRNSKLELDTGIKKRREMRIEEWEKEEVCVHVRDWNR